MDIKELRTYTGRNIFSHKPVVKMVVDLAELTDTTTSELPGFNEQLLKWFPGLQSHYCSPGYEGGFVERLHEGTYLSHVTEHLAIELQCIMGYDVYFGKTRVVKEPSLFCIVFEYVNECCAEQFGRAALEIVDGLANDRPVPIQKILEDLEQTVRYSDLGPSTRAIMNEARKRHIPVRRIGKDSLLQLGYGRNLRYIEASLPDTTSCIAVDLAKNKELAKHILRENNIPVPDGCLAGSLEKALDLADRLGYPVVLKPFDANQGKGVTTNIQNESELRSAYNFAGHYSDQVIVEKQIEGRDYRVLVVGNKVAAAAERTPPYVTGDGIHSIYELVEAENENPLRGRGHERPLSLIKLDGPALELLSRSGLTPDDIPETGQVVPLRENRNLSTGGRARDCTGEMHASNQDLSVKAARAVGLEVAGVDLVCEDIARPLAPQNGAVIEVNAAPGLRMHLYPSEGKPHNVAADIVDLLYPEGTAASIPIISITGTNGKTTVTRMIHHVLLLHGQKAGMTCSSGTYIGRECISHGDNTGPLSARSLLYNRSVEVAVLETARGGIIRKGLGYDLADVGIITNVSDDHLGIDGVESLEDLAFAKSLVVEAVKTDGFAVLNADDRMTDYISRSVQCNIIYFSQSRFNQLLVKHIKNGGMAVSVDNGFITLFWHNSVLPLLKVKDIPITFDGKVSCNIENSLAAISGLLALGIPDEIIKQGIASFKPDAQINAGRFNLFNMGEFQILIDYAHNPSGYQSVIQFIHCLNPYRVIGVIGMPGDRLDRVIFEAGKISGGFFSKLIIKEDADLRGRLPGEVAQILYQGALQGGTREKDLQVILPEMDALETAIFQALPGDLIVVFYENLESVLEIIDLYSVKPVDQSLMQTEMLPSSTIRNTLI
ncbi:MAG: cyanophycin synthetase [Syntrophomonas sp.]